jgi:hypothetical protein
LKRREFIAGLAGTAVRPLAAQAQQGSPTPRLGVLTLGEKGQLSGNWEAFANALRRLGWSDGNNIRIE